MTSRTRFWHHLGPWLSVAVACVAFLAGLSGTACAVAPTPAFDWAMPPRFGLDASPADGIIDPFTDAASISPASWRVDFDACASTGAIVNYRWSVDGVFVQETPRCDGFAYEFPAEGAYTVALEVVDQDGARGTLTQQVVVQDWLIVAWGDSYGSGEGNPDIPILASDFEAYRAAAADLDAAQAALDAAAARARQAQEHAADLVAQGLTVQSRLDTLQQRIRERNDACSGFPDLDCIRASARVVDATADLAAALVPLGLDALINDPTAIQDAIETRINDAIADADAKRAAARETAALRNAARSQLDQAAAALHATWQDRRCHRSARSGQAQAALRIEQADPHTSVTFVHLSCSGGRITAGLLEEDQGIDSPPGAPPIPPQLDVTAALRGRREIDAVLVSVGGNDIGFSKILQSCIADEPCHDPPTVLDATVPIAATLVCSATAIGPSSTACFDYFANLHDPNESAKDVFDAGIAELPGLYDRLDREVRQALPDLPPARLYFTEYPNLLRDQDDHLCAFDPLRPLAMLPGISRDEAAWAEGVATRSLNSTMAAAAARHGWTFVGGLFDRSTPHGYCADDPWLVRLQESFLVQGDAFGTVHPNAAGHASYADALTDALRRDLYVNGDLNTPRLPASRVACAGDCDGDGAVTIDEIVLGVAMVLGTQPMDACPPFDANGDGTVSIDDLLQAVAATLIGC
jgi:hypothetical protein